MKKLLFLLSIVSLNVSAQDIIVKKDGSTIMSKVLEVNQNEIKYKKHSNQNGPIYTISKSDILSINYENGEKDVFGNIHDNLKNTKESPQLSIIKADSRNNELLSLYNRVYQPSDKTKKKKTVAKKGIAIWGVKNTSILSNEDVEMCLISSIRENPNWADKKQRVVAIHIRNKSNKTIYIDKGNCFRIDEVGNYHCYYNMEQLIETTGQGLGVSLGLGSVANIIGINGVAGKLSNGISVGHNSNHSVSRSYSQQRMIAIPAKGFRVLCEPNWIKTKRANIIDAASYETIEDYEVFFLFGARFTHGYLETGGTKIYKEDELPESLKYVITYSNVEDFSTYSTLVAELYVHEIIGCNNLPVRISLNGYDMEKYIKGIDQYTICGNVYFIR